MDIALDDQQRMLRDSVAKVLTDSHPIGRPGTRVPETSAAQAAFWQQAAELGWLAYALPEDVGGLGGAWSDLALIVELLGRHLVVTPFVPSIGYCGAALGIDSVEADLALLTDLGAGARLVSVAYDGGSAMQVEHSDADVVLSGIQKAVPFGDKSDVILVPVATEGNATRLVIVNLSSDGVKVIGRRTVDGGSIADISLNGVRAPLTRKQGNVDAPSFAFDVAAALTAAELVGAMWTLQNLTLEYAKTRSQFGATLSSFQALQHRMVDMYVHCQMAESAMLDAASSLDGDGPDRALRVSRARVHVDQAARAVAEEAIQLHGGIGMTAEYPVGAYMRRITLLRTQFGDERFHRARASRLMRTT